MQNEEVRRRAHIILALVLQARERGEVELAEQLTAHAVRLFEEANGTSDHPEPPSAQPSTSAVPQQQNRTERVDDGKEE